MWVNCSSQKCVWGTWAQPSWVGPNLSPAQHPVQQPAAENAQRKAVSTRQKAIPQNLQPRDFLFQKLVSLHLEAFNGFFFWEFEPLIMLYVKNDLLPLKSPQLSLLSPPPELEGRQSIPLPSLLLSSFLNTSGTSFLRCFFSRWKDYLDIPYIGPICCFRWLFLPTSLPPSASVLLFEMENQHSVCNLRCRCTRNSQCRNDHLCFVCFSFSSNSCHSLHFLVIKSALNTCI